MLKQSKKACVQVLIIALEPTVIGSRHSLPVFAEPQARVTSKPSFRVIYRIDLSAHNRFSVEVLTRTMPDLPRGFIPLS